MKKSFHCLNCNAKVVEDQDIKDNPFKWDIVLPADTIDGKKDGIYFEPLKKEFSRRKFCSKSCLDSYRTKQIEYINALRDKNMSDATLTAKLNSLGERFVFQNSLLYRVSGYPLSSGIPTALSNAKDSYLYTKH